MLGHSECACPLTFVTFSDVSPLEEEVCFVFFSFLFSFKKAVRIEQTGEKNNDCRADSVPVAKKLESSSSAVLLGQAGKCTNTHTLKIVDRTSVAFS